MRIPEGNLATYLVPKSNTGLKSLDGQIEIELKAAQDEAMGLVIKAFGMTLTAGLKHEQQRPIMAGMCEKLR